MNYNHIVQESKLSTKQRNELKDSDFGIPEKRAYPLHDEAHIKAAVKMFPHADPKDKKELARRILMKAHKLGMDTSGWESLQEYVQESVYYLNPDTGNAVVKGITNPPIKDKDTGGKMYEMDEIIIPLIRICNKKGYKTRYCCSGHGPQKHYGTTHDIPSDEPYVFFQAYHDFKDLPTGWYDDTNKEQQNRRDFTGNKGTCIRYKMKHIMNNDNHDDYTTYLAIYNEIVAAIKSLCDYFVKLPEYNGPYEKPNIVSPYERFNLKSIFEQAVDTKETVDDLGEIKNIHDKVSKFAYGFLVNGKPMTDQSKTSFQYMLKYYKTMSINQIEEHHTGICIDHAYYISNALNSKQIKYKTYFMLIANPIFDVVLAHVFTVAFPQSGSKCVYIETASADDNGLFPMDNPTNAIGKTSLSLIKTASKLLSKKSFSKKMSDIMNWDIDILDITDKFPEAGTSYDNFFKYVYKHGTMLKSKRAKKTLDKLFLIYKVTDKIKPVQEYNNIEGVNMFERSPEAFLKRKLYMESDEEGEITSNDPTDMPIPEYMEDRLGITDESELKPKDDISLTSVSDPSSELDSDDTLPSFDDFDNGSNSSDDDNDDDANSQDTNNDSTNDDYEPTNEKKSNYPSRFNNNDESSVSTSEPETDSMEEVKIDFENFGKDNSDVQNEYNEEEIKMLNDLISDEQYSITKYFEGAKNTNDETLRRLYADIGAEESFHAEQLMFAKATLTGEEYTPHNPDVRKEYENLKAMGMDDESAMYTAADKFNLWGGNAALDSDMSELTQEASLLYDMSIQSEILTEIGLEALKNPSDKTNMIMESYYQEEVLNNADAKDIRNVSLPKLIQNILDSSVKIGQKVGNVIKNFIEKTQLRNNATRKFIEKNGLSGLFKSRIHLYFYNTELNKIDVISPWLYADMMYRLSNDIGKECGKTLQIQPVESKLTLVKNNIQRIQYSNIDAGVNVVEKTNFIKTNVVITKNNKDALSAEIFGYNPKKLPGDYVIENKDGTKSTSQNIFNFLRVLSTLCTNYAVAIKEMLTSITGMSGDMSSIYYKARKLWDKCVDHIKIVARGIQKLVTCIAHDLKELLKIQQDVHKMTTARDTAEYNGEEYNGNTVYASDAYINTNPQGKYVRDMNTKERVVKSAKDKSNNFINKTKEKAIEFMNNKNKKK